MQRGELAAAVVAVDDRAPTQGQRRGPETLAQRVVGGRRVKSAQHGGNPIRGDRHIYAGFPG